MTPARVQAIDYTETDMITSGLWADRQALEADLITVCLIPLPFSISLLCISILEAESWDRASFLPALRHSKFSLWKNCYHFPGEWKMGNKGDLDVWVGSFTDTVIEICTVASSLHYFKYRHASAAVAGSIAKCLPNPLGCTKALDS